jgi:hypothetical protein
MRDEIDKQNKLKELLKYHYSNIDTNVKVYAVNDFFRTDGEALNRPDLILLNTPLHKLKFKTGNNMLNPIGIELKDSEEVNATTYGLLQAQNYLEYNYEIRKTGLQVKLNTMTFATSNSIKNGIVCKKFEDNKIVERFAWVLGVPILINHEHNLVWSFRNKYFNLDGSTYGGFGKHAIFYKY